jgi:hypothetical protein
MLKASQVRFKQTTVIVRSLRYKTSVVVPESRVQWLLPKAVAPDVVGIWCGTPRNTGGTVDAFQPDAATATYCLFIEPGGV